MEKRKSAIARIVAVLALAAAVAAVFLVVSSGVKDDSSKGGSKQHHAKQEEKPPPTTAKTYEVKPGDTLIRIAVKTGITVQELKALNPETDPLGLIAGENLKLR
jgi:LysM repeat protein